MSVAHVEVLVEEASAEAAFRVLLPRILGNVSFRIHPHRGKGDLLAKLPGRLKGYAAWIPDDWRILVVVDADTRDCRDLKRELEREAARAGLRTRSSRLGTSSWVVVNRIAVEELEAWFFGDWAAVQAAYPRVDADVPGQAHYRDPDHIRGGTWEALERLLKDAGYYEEGLPKIEVARSVAAHMDPGANTSPSFRALRDVLLECAA